MSYIRPYHLSLIPLCFAFAPNHVVIRSEAEGLRPSNGHVFYTYVLTEE